MNRLLTTLLTAVLALSASLHAQAVANGPFDPQPTLPITGTLDIQYRTRTSDTKGVTDVYTLNLDVAHSVVFRGVIENRPFVHTRFWGADQSAFVRYDAMLVDLVNPRRPSQTLNVAKLVGMVPIDPSNVYHYDEGEGVKIMVYPHGAANGFESRFSGVTRGKPTTHNDSLMQDVIRLSSRKGGTMEVKKYDLMIFENHVLAGGPVQTYPETTVTGQLVYDYEREAWHFNSVHLTYNAKGVRADDVLTGSIRWIEDHKTRRQTGDGHYEFDIRVNEPPPSESAAFGPAQDESAFFSTDDTVAGITGTMTYKDSFFSESEDDVGSSRVAIDLRANRISRVQAMALAKILVFDTLIPLNSE